MNYKTSSQMYNQAKRLVDSYKLENSRLTVHERLSAEHRARDKETLERMSIAITGLSMLMSEYDRDRLVQMINNEGLAKQLIDAMTRLKSRAHKMVC